MKSPTGPGRMNIRDLLTQSIKSIDTRKYPFLRERIGENINEHLWSSIIEIEMNRYFEDNEPECNALREFTLGERPNKPFDIAIVKDRNPVAFIEVKTLGKPTGALLTKMWRDIESLSKCNHRAKKYALGIHAFPLAKTALNGLNSKNFLRLAEKMDLTPTMYHFDDEEIVVPKHLQARFKQPKPSSDRGILLRAHRKPFFFTHDFMKGRTGPKVGMLCCIVELAG